MITQYHAPMGHLGPVLLAALLAACNPFGNREFACQLDSQCDPGGRCANGFCAVADSSCSDGFRYGNAAGDLSNICVGDPGSLDGAPRVDAKVFLDAGEPGVTCVGAGIGKVCFMDADVPTAAVTLTGTIDTDTDAMCSTKVVGHPAWCVVAGTTVTVTSSLAVTGGRPLVLAGVAGDVSIPGTLDVASHKGGQTGAAAASGNDCDPGMAPNNNDGGAGGSYGAKGGKGGNGDATHAVPGDTKPLGLRGGCAGQDGKSGMNGTGGKGGGAVYLISTTQIVVGGAINASGAAGTAGKSGDAGGGGGGAGGFIGLDAPAIMNGGAIFANGGAGAEGSGNTTPGNDGTESVNGAKALGGANGTTNGGDGGDGGATGSPAGTDGKNGGGGGGGGGGGVGYIKLYQATQIMGGTVSPAPTP